MEQNLLEIMNLILEDIQKNPELYMDRVQFLLQKQTNSVSATKEETENKETKNVRDTKDMISDGGKERNGAYRYRCLKKEKSLYGKNRKERRQGRKNYLETCRDLRAYRLYNRDAYRGDVAECKANQKERFAREDANRPTERKYTGYSCYFPKTDDGYYLMEENGVLICEWFNGEETPATENDYAVVNRYGGTEMTSNPLTTKIGDQFHFVQKWEVK